MSCHNGKGIWYPAEFDKKGIKQAADNQYYFIESENRFNETDCILGNGKKHAVISINGKSPPPPLEVEVGAMLHVTVSSIVFYTLTKITNKGTQQFTWWGGSNDSLSWLHIFGRFRLV